MNTVKHTESCHIERSRDVGVPARRLAVALSAASPRADYRAAGFPLQSLTRSTFLTLVLAGPHLLSAQSPDPEPVSYNVVPGGDWSGYDYTYFCPAYLFSDTASVSSNWSILNDNALSLVRAQHNRAFNAVCAYMKSRSGGFYDKLTFEDVEITYADSVAQFDGRGPSVDMEKCGRTKYFFRYRFTPFAGADYRIGIALNDSLEVISAPDFPSNKRGVTFWNVIPPGSAVKSALSHRPTFHVGEIELEYNSDKDCFQWRINEGVPEPTQLGTQKFDYLEVNANTGKIIGKGSFTTFSIH